MDDAFRSLQAGKIIRNNEGYSIADGLRTFLGDINFPIIQGYADRIVTTSEMAIKSEWQNIMERMKIVVEASSAVPVAAISEQSKLFEGKRIGIILTGGNFDMSSLFS